MEKEKKEKKSKYYIESLVLFVALLLSFSLLDDISLLLNIIISLGISLFIFFSLKYNWFKNKKNEQEEKQKEFVKNLDTQALRQLIEDQNEFRDIAEREYDKRKDKSLKEKIESQFWDIVSYGFFIFIFGIFMFGGLANMFGVNNEFTNPTNGSLGLNQSFDIVKDTVLEVTNSFLNVGANHPQLFFWLFWFAVVIGFILPVIKIIIYIIKGMKGGKK